ncbi:unnamed protein product [Amoebophrya sp. A120]|nr:unnamed protein product [Amoebophrya sp. A120]|eukprot:GSA120T00007730001.1
MLKLDTASKILRTHTAGAAYASNCQTWESIGTGSRVSIIIIVIIIMLALSLGLKDLDHTASAKGQDRKHLDQGHGAKLRHLDPERCVECISSTATDALQNQCVCITFFTTTTCTTYGKNNLHYVFHAEQKCITEKKNGMLHELPLEKRSHPSFVSCIILQ